MNVYPEVCYAMLHYYLHKHIEKDYDIVRQDEISFLFSALGNPSIGVRLNYVMLETSNPALPCSGTL